IFNKIFHIIAEFFSFSSWQMNGFWLIRVSKIIDVAPVWWNWLGFSLRFYEIFYARTALSWPIISLEGVRSWVDSHCIKLESHSFLSFSIGNLFIMLITSF